MIGLGIHPRAVVEILGEATIPETTIVEPQAVIYIGPDARLELGERNSLYPNCSIRIEKGWMRTGRDVSFGSGVIIYEPREGLEIGDSCMIAGGVMMCGVSHNTQRIDIPMREQGYAARKITLEDDVWIGMGAVIMPGVTIGRGSIIGAGSVVTRDIPPLSVAWGSPCAVQQTRQPSDPRPTFQGPL